MFLKTSMISRFCSFSDGTLNMHHHIDTIVAPRMSATISSPAKTRQYLNRYCLDISVRAFGEIPAILSPTKLSLVLLYMLLFPMTVFNQNEKISQLENQITLLV